MKESKKRENLNSKRQKPSNKLTSLETWDQTDLEDADEKALEKRLHQLKLQLQLAQDEPQSRLSHHSSSKQKKKYNQNDMTSESDVSESVSSMSNISSGSVHKNKSKKSSSYSDDERSRSRPRNIRSVYKKQSKQTGQSNINLNDDKSDTRTLTRRKVSPLTGKRSSRVRSRKSPSLDKRDLYNRLDTDRWHDKAKEFEKERNVKSKNDAEKDRSRIRSRADRDRDRNHDRDRGRHTNDQREITRASRNDRTTTSTKRPATLMRGVRRKESSESSVYRTRTAASAAVIATTTTKTSGASIVSYDNGSRRGTVMSRKLSPKDEKLGRQDDRRADCKGIRRNDSRSGDLREPISRARDFRDRKDRSLSILADKSRDFREPVDHNARSDHRERSVKINDDRFKEREVKRLTVHDRLGPRTDSRDAADANASKFRRLSSELAARIPSAKEIASSSVLQRYSATATSPSSSSESVFDRMRNRYNDRKNTVGITVCDQRSLPSETSGINRLPTERRRNFGTLVLGTRRSRSPIANINRDYKDAEKSSCVALDRRILSPANSRKSRDTDGRVAGGGEGEGSTNFRNTEDDNSRSNTAEEKNKTSQARSRSRSSERRKRRRSSQEEWRVIDMTSPIDDQMANETNRLSDTAAKLKRSIASKYTSLNSETFTDADGKKRNRLTDELSDISDEDFNEANVTDSLRIKKDSKQKNDTLMTIQSDTVDQKLIVDQNTSMNTLESEKCSSPSNEQNVFANNEMDVFLGEQQKKTGEDANTNISALSMAAVTTTTSDKISTENIDSEEETDSFTVSRVSDALGVDWADFVEESKRKRTEAASYEQEMTGDVKRRWNTTIILTKVGVSAKYVGEDVFEMVRRDAEAQYAVKSENEQPNEQCAYDGHKFLHVVPALHSCLNNRMAQKTSCFEPYKTAISARKDIVLRRKLCGLPVKNSHSQHLIGICHWIV